MFGPCAKGTMQCSLGSLECVSAVSPVAETCDSVDNDCNGTTDDVLGVGDYCDTGQLGPCADGMYQCSGGFLDCVETTFAQAETCNDFTDNDCDGVVDDGCGGGVPQGSCSHSLCTTGTALVSGCSACATQICAADGFCCSTSWDSICVGEVKSVCGLTCP
jgi:hypothetical protein